MRFSSASPLVRALVMATASAAFIAGACVSIAFAQSGAPRSGPAMPDSLKMNMLIRTTLIALSQANATGNYSVLRDLGSPDFQLNNTQAKLTEAFTELRRRKLDFSPVLFFDPKLVREPTIDDAGRLRLTGFIDTQPEQVTFDMMFAQVNNEWRLFGVAVEMRNNPDPAPSQKQPASPPVAAGKDPAAKAKPAPGKGSTNRNEAK